MKRIFLTLILSFLLVSSAFAGQRYIKFDAQTGGWTTTNTITGATSGATAVIKAIQDDGTTGILELIQVTGTFVDDEIIYESALGVELLTDWDCEADPGVAWSDYSTPTTNERSTEQQHQALSSRKFIGDTSQDGVANQTAVVVVNSFYISTAWVYINDLGGSTEVRLIVRRNDTFAAYSGWDKTSVIGSWAQLTQVFKAIHTGTAMTVTQSGDGDTTVYTDDTSLKQITNAALANGSPFGGARAIW